MNAGLVRNHLVLTSALLFTLTGAAAAGDPAALRADLLSAGGRKPAPDFALKDSSGKTVS